EIHQGLRDALAELPEKCRQVFVLSYVNNLKSKEIAEVMNISVRTVEAHIYKALKLLRSRLKHLAQHTLVILIAIGVSSFAELYVK
ncbi:MAG: sigma-70 family RNA polymerase sigma factor, partial [Muribaculaceae bacterium]|nr:sigma-70 family RNA polymerase sigma factor [Muribaculaceae bacterium]